MLHPDLIGVRACIFDVGGTLVHPDWPRLVQLAESASGQSFEVHDLGRAFSKMLQEVNVEMQRDGFVTPDEMKRPHWTFRRMYASLGIADEVCERIIEDLRTSHDERHIWCGLDPEAGDVIRALRKDGFILAVISNTEDGRLEDSLSAAGIADAFDLKVDSQRVGIRKPDPAIFNFALERLRLHPDEAVYVGDSYVFDALAARTAGLRGILLDPHDLHREVECARIHSLRELIGA